MTLIMSSVQCCAEWAPHLSAALEQIYDSNIFLEPDGVSRHDSKSDFRTNVSTTLGITNETHLRSFTLEYTPTYSYFVKNSNESYVSHAAAMNLRQNLTKYISIYMEDNFFYSEEPIAQYGDMESTSVNYDRRKNITNSGEGGFLFQFGYENFLKIYYSDDRLIYPDNNSYDVNGHRVQTDDNSVAYGPGAEITYWLTQRNGVNLAYQWQRIDYDIRESKRIDHVDAGYSYRWSPNTILSVDYIFDDVRTEGHISPDYKINQAQAGFERIFSRSLTLDLMAGYYHRSMEKSQFEERNQLSTDSSENDGFMGRVGLNFTRSNWHVTVAGESGVRLEFTDYNNRGYTPYRLVTMNGQYDFTDRLHGFLGLSYTHEMSPDTLTALVQGDRRTETYNISTRLEYLLLKWLTCSLEYAYNDQSETQISNQYAAGYNDNVVMFRLNAIYDWLEHTANRNQNYDTIPSQHHSRTTISR